MTSGLTRRQHGREPAVNASSQVSTVMSSWHARLIADLQATHPQLVTRPRRTWPRSASHSGPANFGVFSTHQWTFGDGFQTLRRSSKSLLTRGGAARRGRPVGSRGPLKGPILVSMPGRRSKRDGFQTLSSAACQVLRSTNSANGTSPVSRSMRSLVGTRCTVRRSSPTWIEHASHGGGLSARWPTTLWPGRRRDTERALLSPWWRRSSMCMAGLWPGSSAERACVSGPGEVARAGRAVGQGRRVAHGAGVRPLRAPRSNLLGSGPLLPRGGRPRAWCR